MNISKGIKNYVGLMMTILTLLVIGTGAWCVYTTWLSAKRIDALNYHVIYDVNGTTGDIHELEERLYKLERETGRIFNPLYLYDDIVVTGLDRRLANKDQLIIELDNRIAKLEAR